IGCAAGEHRDLDQWHENLSCLQAPGLYSHYCASSYPAKKKLSSKRAVSSASEPWMALCSMLAAHFLRIVPSSALAGLVAPISLRRSAMAFSFSSASATMGPLDMNWVSELKNDLCAWTA